MAHDNTELNSTLVCYPLHQAPENIEQYADIATASLSNAGAWSSHLTLLALSHLLRDAWP